MVNDTGTSHVRWFLVCWLFVLSAVSYLDRVNISVAGRSIAADYGLSNVQLGYVFSAMLIGYSLLQTVGGNSPTVSDLAACSLRESHGGESSLG